MQDEIMALEQNQTWVLTDLPPRKWPIGSKWVYKLKLNVSGTVERYKARIVAKGYNHIREFDYSECFSPVVKVVTVRVFFFVAAMKAWSIHHININNSSLHGFLDEEFYMTRPKGYSKAQQGASLSFEAFSV